MVKSKRAMVAVVAFVMGGFGLGARGADVVGRPEGVVVEGVPEVKRGLAEEIRRYGQARAAVFGGWRPAGRQMLVTTRFGETMQVHAVAGPGAARRQLTFYSDAVAGASYPVVGDGSYFVFTKDHDGDEQYQKYRFDLATGKETLLTDGKSRNTGTSWSKDGKWVAYGSTRRTGKDVDFWVVDPKDPKSDRMVAKNEGGGWGAEDWSPDGGTLLAVEYVSIVEQRLWLVDVNSGEKKRIAEGEGKLVLAGAQFAADGKGIYVATDRGSEFQRLAYFDLGTGEWKVLTADIPWDIEEFRLSWDGKRIALVTNEEGWSVLRVMDVATGKMRVVEGLPKGVIGGVQWNRNNREAGFTAGSAKTTADAYSVDVESGTVERWTESETGGVPGSEFVEPELVKWKSFDEREIPGFVYRPDRERFKGKRPVIVLVHGGPEGQARPGFIGSYNYYVNELGCVLIQPNVRGSAGYGKGYLALDDGLKREDSYKDVGALLDWIGTQPDLDNDRVMVTGGSYGGNVTYAVAVMYPEKIRCAISIVGAANLVTFLENTSAYRRDLRRVEYGDERDPKVREFLLRIAPINHLDKMVKPLMVVQDGNDPRVPASEAEQIVKAMKEKGKDVWYLLAKDEGHGFGKQANKEYEQAVRAEFVKRFLVD